MLKRRLYKCENPECGRVVPILSKHKNSDGTTSRLCPACREMARRKSGETTMKTKKPKPKKGSPELKKFFEKHVAEVKVSFESGKPISDPSKKNVAHLFPKRTYKSVQCSDDNVVYLTWQEHTDFDRYLDTRDLKKLETFFPKTWERMKNIVSLVEEQGSLKEFVLNEV